ncbi:MAG TPA: CBS domain-containing protein [Gaiellaceae bacterium]|nr:CBS domain-containing protein [Gaiellaceae bacterium]
MDVESQLAGEVRGREPLEQDLDEIRVDEVMHPGIIFSPPELPLRHAAGLMARHQVHAVVVMGDDEEGGLWGLVTDDDIVAAIARRELVGDTVGGIVHEPLVTVARDDTVVHAAELMQENGTAHLLVIAKGRPVGVVSTLDLARAAA